MAQHGLLEDVAFLPVEFGDAGYVVEQALVPPAVEERQRENLRQGVWLQVRHRALMVNGL